MRASSRKGFTLVEAVVIVAVIGVLGLVGFKFWSAMHDQQAAKAPTTTSDVATVKKATDLDTVNKQLDSVNVAGSFDKDLDSASSF